MPSRNLCVKIRTILPGIFFLLGTTGSLAADSIFPMTEGTAWNYRMTQEFGAGVRVDDPSAKPDADGKFRVPVTIRITGTETIDGVEVQRFEMRRQDRLQVIQFIQVNEKGMFEVARGDESGERINLSPPQKILSFPLKVGEKWEYHGQGAGEQVDETYEIVARESVQVPAGKFNAYHLRVIGTQPFHSVVDRWYVADVGEVKDVTEVRRPNGAMLQRITLELLEAPKIPPTTPTQPRAKKLSVILGEAAETTTRFPADRPKVIARWQANGLGKGTKLRASWIAEDVGNVAPPNHKIDEATVVLPDPNANGVFSLSRPNAGWPLGAYRVEFFAGDELVETMQFTIAK